VNRRTFITLVGGASAWPLAAWAQQPAKAPTIGYLSGATPAAESQRGAAFVQRLRELGWIDGHTIAIQSRWAEGRTEQFAEIAVEFVRQKVDIIVATGTPPALAAKQATSVIPIVFVAVADPLGTGLVASLARPGGNITGLSSQFTDIVGKRLELLHEVVATMALVPSGAQQWMCAAVVFEVNPLNVALTCNVWAVGSSTTVAKPVPAGLTGGTSFAPERFTAKVIGTAWAAGTGSIRAATDD